MNLVFSFSSAIIAKYKKKVQNKHSNSFCTLTESIIHITLVFNLHLIQFHILSDNNKASLL